MLLIPLLQLVLASAACAALYWLFERTVAGAGPRGRAIIAVGFLARAFAGMALFWISYLRLPIARGLQLGEGFWFFAVDSEGYFRWASTAARHGFAGVTHLDPQLPSPFFVKSLGYALLLFGSVPSIGLLLNCLAYLLICLVIVAWGKVSDSRTATLIALAAISLSPSAILWSLQPLKDTVFVCVIVGFLGGATAWYVEWRGERRPSRLAIAAAVMLFCMYGIGGIRWYFAGAALAATAVFFAVTALRLPARRLAPLGCSLVLWVGLARALIAGGGVYVPDVVKGVFSPKRSLAAIGALPRFVLDNLPRARSSFDSAAGATLIGAGRTVEKAGGPATRVVVRPSPAPPPAAATATIAAVRPPAAPPRSTRRLGPGERAADGAVHREQTKAQPASASTASTPIESASEARTDAATQGSSPSAAQVAAPAVAENAPARSRGVADGLNANAPAPAPAAPKSAAAVNTAANGPATAATSTSTATPASAPAVAAAGSSVRPATPQISAAAPPPPESAAGSRQTSATEGPRAAVRQAAARRHVTEAETARAHASTHANVPSDQQTGTAAVPAAPAPVTKTAASPVQRQTTNAAGAAAAATRSEGASNETIVVPQSTFGRMVTGSAALILPRAVAQSLGLIQVHGGRGFWLFVEIDTLVFDAALVVALASVIRRLRERRMPNAVFWLVLIVAGTIAVLLAYTVSNFGTLFRHRMMVYVCLALMPLALSVLTTHDEPLPSASEPT